MFDSCPKTQRTILNLKMWRTIPKLRIWTGPRGSLRQEMAVGGEAGQSSSSLPQFWSLGCNNTCNFSVGQAVWEKTLIRHLHCVLKIRTTQTSFSWAPEGLGSEFLLLQGCILFADMEARDYATKYAFRWAWESLWIKPSLHSDWQNIFRCQAGRFLLLASSPDNLNFSLKI